MDTMNRHVESSEVVWPAFLRREEDGALLALKVVPGASRDEIVGIHGDRLRIRVSAPPEDGAANRSVLKLLKKQLHAEDVQLVAGTASPLKTVRVWCSAERLIELCRTVE
ncbi:MAG: YggU family protein [Deltaproteobacteria bacterium]|nr:YggU family protein [Deltaproteobacteria bacterium]